MGEIVPLLFFYKDDFAIKQLTKVDLALNIETKPNQFRKITT